MIDPFNPQSWNRYAYVNNNPLNSVDPWGLYCLIGHCSDPAPPPPPDPGWQPDPDPCVTYGCGFPSPPGTEEPQPTAEDLAPPRLVRQRTTATTSNQNPCFESVQVSDSFSAQFSGLAGLMNNPFTHMLDDVTLMGGGALMGAGTVAFDVYAFGQTAGAATPLLLLSNPALFYGSWQATKTGYNKFQNDINELQNVVHDLVHDLKKKPGC